MDRPLKWHKFLIYFALWLGALGSLLAGASLLFMGLSGSKTEPFYQLPAIRTLNIVYGVIYIAYAVYEIYTRYQLARFMKGAPKKLLIMYIIYPVLQFTYATLILVVTGLPISLLLQNKANFMENLIISVAGTGILCILHKIYYDKRKVLFVN